MFIHIWPDDTFSEEFPFDSFPEGTRVIEVPDDTDWGDIEAIVEEITMKAATQKILALHSAGSVVRNHTRPGWGTYPVGVHIYGGLALLKMLCPPEVRTLGLVDAFTFHDSGETFAGDTPHTLKMMEPAIDRMLESFEIKVRMHLGVEQHLTDEEEFWLKLIDRLEYLVHLKTLPWEDPREDVVIQILMKMDLPANVIAFMEDLQTEGQVFVSQFMEY